MCERCDKFSILLILLLQPLPCLVRRMGNVNVEEEEKGGAALLSSLPALLRSPQQSGTLTPPLHAPASVPFQWEEQPGKPFPGPPSSATTNAAASFINISFKSLELPPRLLNNNNNVKGGKCRPRSLLESSSLRFLCHKKGHFDQDSSPSSGTRLLPSHMNNRKKEKGVFLFGSWKKAGHSSYASNNQVDASTLMLSANNTHLSAPFWATIYGSLKQVSPRIRKRRNDAL